VALKMVFEREAQIDAFTPQEYWTISADLLKKRLYLQLSFQNLKTKKLK
jgi:DNA topoisomerase IA